jgi:hypothetical protein
MYIRPKTGGNAVGKAGSGYVQGQDRGLAHLSYTDNIFFCP